MHTLLARSGWRAYSIGMLPFVILIPVIALLLAAPAWAWSRCRRQFSTLDVAAVFLPLPVFVSCSLLGFYCDDDGAYLIAGMMLMPVIAVVLTWIRVALVDRYARNTRRVSWIFFVLVALLVPMGTAFLIPDDHCEPCESCEGPDCYERCGG